ncbi:MAG: hypothetical protein AMXMBFR26_04470 [Porticoccaceae bacterium]
MVARTRPPRKIGQLSAGPIDQKRLLQSKKSPALSLASPAPPSSENRGYSSAVATPMRAVAAASSRSARRRSGRRRSRSDGSPAGSPAGAAGIGAAASSSASSAPGGAPSSTARR